MLTICPSHLLRPEIVHNIMTSISQQAVEIIDRTRGLAGSLFCKLIHQYALRLCHFLHRLNFYFFNNLI